MNSKGGADMITETDRYFIERKYHDPKKEFNAFKRMADRKSVV